MWCGRKGIDCRYCGVFGECHRSACGLPNAEPSTLGTSSSYLVNTTTEKYIDDIKREAVKEFAEKLKEEYKALEQHYICMYDWNEHSAVYECEIKIDELLKEYEK